ncbi:MAG: alpha-E domain-containing protein [Minwuia sp.]|uniref:alpha-E domain-containing protein n=1 Tax=Minwuia sp. TaxID=2493630 RepID=UPI003A8AFADD
MLSRTADDIFWISRYIERAENLARLLEVADRMALMPAEVDTTREWHSVLIAAGVEPLYLKKHRQVTEADALHFIAFDEENPSSIHNCLKGARENARAQRHTITRELWEAINDTWHGYRDMTPEKMAARGRVEVIEWVKQRSHLVRGAVAGTMIRDDLYNFMRLGTFIERSDSTARILDVKYHLILPEGAPVGGAADYYQWTALLQSVSAHVNYRRLFGEAVRPIRVAELLVLRPEMPRSIRSCYDEIVRNLEMLAQDYGRKLESMRMAGKLHSELKYDTVDEVFLGQGGLHAFLTKVVDMNIQIGKQIQRDFLLLPADLEEDESQSQSVA